MSLHRALVNLSNTLGYPKVSGYCHGSAIRWLEAALLNQEPLFDKRMRKIEYESPRIIESINRLKTGQLQKLANEGIDTIDMLGFLDSLSTYQNPCKRTTLFDTHKKLNQYHIPNVSEIAGSDEIRRVGGLVKAFSTSHIATEFEIKCYLDALGHLISKANALSQEPVGFIVSNFNHSVALMCKPGSGWKFMDMNQYPAQRFMFSQTHKLAQQIVLGFEKKDRFQAFNSMALVPGSYSKTALLKQEIQHTTFFNNLSPEIVKRESRGIHLMHLAAETGDIFLLKKLLSLGLDANPKDGIGSTPFLYAASQDQIEAMILLAKYNVNVDHANTKEGTAAHIGAEMANTAVISLLHQLNANLDSVNSKLKTPAYIAAEEGHASIIYQLAKYKVNLDRKAGNGWSPLKVALHKGHLPAVVALIESGADIGTLDPQSLVHLKKTTEQKEHTHLANLLNKKGQGFKMFLFFSQQVSLMQEEKNLKRQSGNIINKTVIS